MDNKHTPGPWEVSGSEIRSQSEQIIIAGTYYVGTARRGQVEANARLIAAAPDLLTSLKALLPEGWGDDDTMDHMPGVKLARAAIAKAEGRLV